MISKNDFNLLDPKLKDYDWAMRVVRYLVLNRNSLCVDKNVWELRSWQHSQYDIRPFKIPYYHILPVSEGGVLSEEEAKTALKIDFTPLGLFEIIKNVLNGEIAREDIYIEANCFDPTILAKKEDEFALFKNKGIIEKQVNELYRGIGVPADYKVGSEGEFESNLNEFEGMGLNPTDQGDIEFFSTTFYRHEIETDATSIINELNKLNEIGEIQINHINDMLALKRMAMQTYYNTSTGLPTTKYLYPEFVYYTGKVSRNDFKDALSMSWEETMTITDFLKMVGDEDFTKEDYDYLLTVSNVTQAYPGMDCSQGIDWNYTPVTPAGFISIVNYYNLFVTVGYIEWKTTDRNEVGRYFQKTKKCYYIANLTQPYRLYKYGYLNVMAREGYESELSCFSISAYREEGRSMLEIALPYYKRIFSNWLKYQYFLEIAKPDGYAYQLEALRNVAKEIISKGGNQNDIIAAMRMFKASSDMVYSMGDEDSQQTIGGNGLPYQKLEHGIDDTAIQFLQSIDWCKVQIEQETGLNQARIAQSPPTDQPNRTTAAVTNQSQNATEYLNSALASLYGGSAYRTFCILQSIIEFDFFGIDQLKKIFGERYIRVVKFMKKIPIQYFGINIRRIFRKVEREEIKTMTMQSVIAGEITPEIAIIINEVDTYQKAASVLTYYKERIRKQKIQEQAQLQQNAMQSQAQVHKNKMEEIDLEGKIKIAVEKEITQRDITVAKIEGGMKIEQQTQRLQNQPLTNEQRSNLKKAEDTHKTALETTKQLVTDNHREPVNQD